MLLRGCCIACTGVATALEVKSPLVVVLNSMMIAFCIRVRPYLFSHYINTFLGLLNHLNCAGPFLLELILCFLNVFQFNADPFLELLPLLSVSTWRKLPRFIHFLYVLSFLLNPVIKCLFAHVNNIEELVILDHVL